MQMGFLCTPMLFSFCVTICTFVNNSHQNKNPALNPCPDELILLYFVLMEFYLLDFFSRRRLKLTNRMGHQGLLKLHKNQLAVDLKQIVWKMGISRIQFQGYHFDWKNNITMSSVCIVSILRIRLSWV